MGRGDECLQRCGQQNIDAVEEECEDGRSDRKEKREPIQTVKGGGKTNNTTDV